MQSCSAMFMSTSEPLWIAAIAAMRKVSLVHFSTASGITCSISFVTNIIKITTQMEKYALAIIGYQQDSLNYASDDATYVKRVHDNIKSFLTVNRTRFCSIIMAHRSITAFSPYFSENWRFATTSLPVPPRSIVYRTDATASSFYVATQRVVYRFPTLLAGFISILPKEFTLTEPILSANSSGAQVCLPDDMKGGIQFVNIDDPENIDVNMSPFKKGVTKIFVAGHIHSPLDLVMILLWSQGARVYVMTDLTRGSSFDHADVTNIHSFDVFGRSYIPNPIPLHIQPIRGGLAEATRIWETSLYAMQSLATVMHPQHPPPEMTINAPLNPVCRSLPPGRGTLKFLGPNYVFLTVFCVRITGDEKHLPRYFALTGADIYATLDPLLYDLRGLCDTTWGKTPDITFGEPHVVYSGYLPDGANTLHAWKHCMVMAVGVNGVSIDVLGRTSLVDKPQTSFEGEMCELVRWIDTYHADDPMSPVCRALQTMSAFELAGLLGEGNYSVGNGLVQAMTGTRDPLDGSILCAWLAGDVDKVDELNGVPILGRDGSEVVPILERSWARDTPWDRVAYGNNEALRSFFSKIRISNEDDARAARLMIGAAVEKNINRFLDAVYDIIGTDQQVSRHAYNRAVSVMSDTRVLLKAYDGE